MVTGVSGPSTGTSGVSGPSGSGSGGQSSINTLAQKLGVSPQELVKALELLLKIEAQNKKPQNNNLLQMLKDLLNAIKDKGNSSPSGQAGDVNGDGKVDEKDKALEALAQRILKSLDEKPSTSGETGQQSQSAAPSTAGIDGGGAGMGGGGNAIS